MPIFDDTRSDWKAAPPKHAVSTVSPSRRTGCMWHWNGPAMRLAGRSHSACLLAVRADQRFHQGPSRGWNDVGYNGLICPHGRTIEGRGINAIGAHCTGYNTGWYGFQFMLGEGERVTAEQWSRAQRLIRDVNARSGHTLRHLPHSAGFATSCPGPEITRWTKAGAVAGSGGGSTPGPVSGGGSATPVFVEDDVQLDDNLPLSSTEKKVWEVKSMTVLEGLKSGVYARRFAYEAKVDAASTLEIVKTLAAKAGLSPADIEAAAKRGAAQAIEDKIADADVTLTVEK